ncbi:MAG: DNA-3-methyladenine glycosylase 2 family protein [Deltaproteobacteria bacterium]|nr:DNA-3-methyladenine glycosylase 2 family protein [Deltaproteobacteria bacterium]MBI3387888.1 DNA-3-methyladenine glycosylase 2 family protein [Deltaproteobacteria bacterium]
MTLPAHAICYRALLTRDIRFDGRLFVGVSSTGIYCRPICPARTAKPENCRFFPSAAAAQEAGFRPCLRCRPELSPDAAAWRGTSNTVSRALALIAEGALDGGEAGVEALAARLGMGERQLRRLFDQHLGVPPVAVAQTRRVLFAKQLIQETSLSMIDIAEASGFGSVRRFNDAFVKLYRRSPRQLRSKKRIAPSAVTLRLGYRPPYDWDAMLSFLAARAIDGVELIENDHYFRTIAIDEAAGSVEVAPGRNCLLATIRVSHVRALLAIVARLRRLFDLDTDVEAIGAHLKSDEGLAPLIARRPGLRAPGAWDGFELAERAILGQQVTVVAARRLAGKLAALAGTRTTPDVTGHEQLTRIFPTPTQVVASDLAEFGMPRARIEAVQALARAAVADPKLLEPAGTYDDVIERLLALPGFGPWTAEYWALRALRDSDAFPAGDVALMRSPAVANGTPLSPKALLERAEAWRPWRAYAAQHLWTADADARRANG